MEHSTGEASVIVVADETEQELVARRQQHRNVFAERCRLAGVRAPDEATMLVWWPGTKAVFA